MEAAEPLERTRAPGLDARGLAALDGGTGPRDTLARLIRAHLELGLWLTVT